MSFSFLLLLTNITNLSYKQEEYEQIKAFLRQTSDSRGSTVSSGSEEVNYTFVPVNLSAAGGEGRGGEEEKDLKDELVKEEKKKEKKVEKEKKKKEVKKEEMEEEDAMIKEIFEVSEDGTTNTAGQEGFSSRDLNGGEGDNTRDLNAGGELT